jgi:hypothetical protein
VGRGGSGSAAARATSASRGKATTFTQSSCWLFCLRGGRIPSVRLCSCAGAQASYQAQLPRRSSASCLCHWVRSRSRAAARATSASYGPGQLTDLQTKRSRSVGYFASEEDAAPGRGHQRSTCVTGRKDDLFTRHRAVRSATRIIPTTEAPPLTQPSRSSSGRAAASPLAALAAGVITQ